jgi:hypothetical protein
VLQVSFFKNAGFYLVIKGCHIMKKLLVFGILLWFGSFCENLLLKIVILWVRICENSIFVCQKITLDYFYLFMIATTVTSTILSHRLRIVCIRNKV